MTPKTSDFPRIEGGWRTILADPPWPEYGSGRVLRGAQRHYPLMSINQIRGLPVHEIAAEQSHLYLWTTNNYLLEALGVMESWGFNYKTCITWAKDRFGLGQYFRGMTEHCLFGTRGPSLPYRAKADGKRAQGVTLIASSRGEHSEKPPKIYEFAETVSYPPRLELFARQKRQGWTVWGLEAPTVTQAVLDHAFSK